jgi:hypothetical protein
MASKRPSLMKRERERKLAERAALKREQRARRDASKPVAGDNVATYEDLEGYGIAGPIGVEERRRS